MVQPWANVKYTMLRFASGKNNVGNAKTMRAGGRSECALKFTLGGHAQYDMFWHVAAQTWEDS